MIRFGTDGWRALIAADFTTDNAKQVFQAIADYLLDLPADQVVAVGYDTRFLSRYYAELAASVLAANDIRVQFSSNYVSTPNVSYQVFEQKLAGGIVISASHNPPNYNGIKFKAVYAGSASSEITSCIEAKLTKTSPRLFDFNKATEKGWIESVDFRTAYLEKIKSYVDFSAISSAKLKVIVDSMGGAGQGYLETLFEETNIDVVPLRSKPDPLFYGVNPEPIAENLGELSDEIVKQAADLGIAFDGDADRIGGMDDLGEYLSSHQIFSLLLKHFYENRQARGRVIKTVSVTSMIEKLAYKYAQELIETPVGFKYICAEILKGGVLIGGEESGGIGVIDHIPERDAVLNALLLLELVVKSGKSIRELWAELVKEFGPHYFKRIDRAFSSADFQKIKRRLYSFSESENIEFAGYPVKELNRRDGYKFIFEDDKGWLMVRLSGTEPVLRLYCEAQSYKEVDLILAASLKRFSP